MVMRVMVPRPSSPSWPATQCHLQQSGVLVRGGGCATRRDVLRSTAHADVLPMATLLVGRLVMSKGVILSID